ncbi:hypothetical protein BK133_16765 [Paenibacillus sp. FSL H8-0548]|uniref:hypothetical protein n=1 Tax=Paenibacillus sp. FSL H8-0548 TaxID=1920422 RepID=UPI00096F07BF|nr:hypothetical protein [Paenibacillus sp. FSL H8-0548]OMF30786.1 hypothetical protein BK133_16765 [Paenibacillus sp. FSL H8-0548]
MNERDEQYAVDQWGGMDSLGRELPSRENTGPIRKDRYVGLFYFLWLGQHGTLGPFDNTNIVAEWPEAVHDSEHPAWGPLQAFHFWGEPLYGYYLNDDAWVLRKHVQLLTSAGVDFLIFDTTNTDIYKKVYDVLFQILDDVYRQGFKVPQFAFYTNTESGQTVSEIFEDIYKPGRYKHLWFHWKGRPLIIGNPDECDEEHRQFFTFRLNQWPNEEAKTNGFPWIEFQRPQRVFYNNEGQKEVINVSVAQHPSIAMSDTPFYGYGDNWGRDYSEAQVERIADSSDAIYQGLNIAEQWAFALQEDPQIIFVTGWNEWIAMRFKGMPERPVLFVDQATLNFSRDIEPMKDGYGDLYYMQLISYIRKFKGMSDHDGGAVQLDEPLMIDEDFTIWHHISREYIDFVGDEEPRNHPGYGELHYQNDTVRNSFVKLKAAHTDENLYFYAQTKEPISPCTDRHWMMLLIRVKTESGPGWEGYHYIINRSVKDNSITWLEQSTGDWNWEPVGELRYAVSGNELQIELPLSFIGIDEAGKGLWLEFKWIDNMQNDGEIMDFFQYGDTAPEGRLNYIYKYVE